MVKLIDRFKFAVKSFNTYNTIASKDGGFFYPLNINGLIEQQETGTVTGQIVAWKRCQALQSVINKKVRASLNGKYFLMDADKKESTTPFALYFKKLMAKPNVFQTWVQFEAQAKIYIQAFGECYILPIMPLGFTDKTKDVSAMWVIPNWLITPTFTGKSFSQNKLDGIIVNYKIGNINDNYTLLPEQLINIQDFNLSTDNFLQAQSRMVCLADPITNIIAAYEARHGLIVRKGGIGILSNNSKDSVGTIPLDTKEKKEVQDSFRNYGFTKNDYNVIITNAALTWQSMTFPTKDLMLFEEIEDSTRAICDVYEFPIEMLGFKGNSMFDSGEKYAAIQRALYENTIIPESANFVQAFNQWFEFDKYGKFTLQVFYDHLSFFKKNQKEKADALRFMAQGLQVLYTHKLITETEARQEIANIMEIDPTKFEGTTFFEGAIPPQLPITTNQNG